MSGSVLTFPIKPGKVEAWRRFCQEMSGSQREAYEASRRTLGITRERLALVTTAFGSTAVSTLEAPDVAGALGQIIASVLPFDIWYREQMQELHGINLAGYELYSKRSPPPQKQEVHFEWAPDIEPNSAGRLRPGGEFCTGGLHCSGHRRKPGAA